MIGYRTASDTTTGIASLLPAGFAAVEALGAAEPDALMADEHALVARAVAKRQLELARGRSCARRAMAVLGVEPAAIPSEPGGAPIWPAGLIGSITHCRDYACAAVARAGPWISIGIDAEVLQPIDQPTRELILLPSEQRHVDALGEDVAWASVIFSAKEALYKACYPLVRRWIDFHDVELRLDLAGHFAVDWKIALDLPGSISGRFVLDAGRVLAVVVIAA